MKQLTIEGIEKDGLLLYKYIRGSIAHGTNTPDSDTDIGGVYMQPEDILLGLGFDYQDEICEDNNNVSYFEIGKFMRLLLKSNPTVLESLFIDDEFVIYEHPIITELKKSRERFITKKCFSSFGAYAVSQIKKCRSLNKKMLHDEETEPVRPTVLSFCYTHYRQGSTKIENWLEYRGLKQEYCGLNKIPNMRDEYGVFYDWGSHFEKEGYDECDAVTHYLACRSSQEMNDGNLINDTKYKVGRYIVERYGGAGFSDETRRKPLRYRGIIKDSESTCVRLSSIEDKNDTPICHMSFNMDGFVKSCKDYRELKEWIEKRNPKRYESNRGKNYDAKNVSESFRLMAMCTEIANGDGFIVNRKGIDREFLLDVKNHKYGYEEIIKMLEEKKAEMDKAIDGSTIPDEIDTDFVNNFIIKIRKNGMRQN